MQVVIPLAGKGTRLRPHTWSAPKPLVHVGGRPVMSYIMDDLLELGVEEVVFITGYLQDRVEAYMAAEYPQLKTTYVEQKVQDGTAGAVKLAQPHIHEDLLIIFVDTLFDADLGLIQRLPEDVSGVLWAKEVEDYQRFGVIVTDDDGNMERIVEKPSEPISKLANIGLYYIRDWQLLFAGVDHALKAPQGPGKEFYLTDAFQYMVDHGARIRVGEVEGWYDCGKMDTLLETNRHLLETTRGQAPTPAAGVTVHEPVRVEEGVTLEDAEIGPNVTLEAGATVRGSTLVDTIVGRDARVEGARLKDSMVGERTVVKGVSGTVNVGADAEVSAG